MGWSPLGAPLFLASCSSQFLSFDLLLWHWIHLQTSEYTFRMAFQIAQHTQEIMMTLVSLIGNEIMQRKKNESNLTVSRFGILETTLSLFLLLRWCLTERHWGT
ncbi:hypothetical protein L3X38_043543 [Prunus dulcis]|uniref:Uncharacterized protein n=1 Tax=Prunus dulcis TaxID=3755 RepID=A0AAD4UYM2_PRUDU|nr:hypothetical protein L3X38_043543 [Prunus dulcis]